MQRVEIAVIVIVKPIFPLISFLAFVEVLFNKINLIVSLTKKSYTSTPMVLLLTICRILNLYNISLGYHLPRLF